MIKKFRIILVFYLVIPMTVMGGIVNPPEIIHKVEPQNGSLYFTNNYLKGLDVYSYNYIFDFTNSNTDTRNYLNNLSLEIFNPTASAGEDKWIKSDQAKSINGSQLIFKVNLSEKFKEPYLGKSKYRLKDTSSSGKIIAGSSGPEIKVNFRNENSSKKGANRYDYSVEIRSVINGLNIYLYSPDSSGSWQQVNTPKIYTSSKGEWKRLVWNDASYYRMLEFVADPKALNVSDHLYYISIK